MNSRGFQHGGNRRTRTLEFDTQIRERLGRISLLEERDVVTSPVAYLELLIVLERHQLDYVRLFANLLDIVPVGDETEQQIVLKAVTYFDDGMTPFDSFHAATTETRGCSILTSDKAYEDVDLDRLALEPNSD